MASFGSTVSAWAMTGLIATSAAPARAATCVGDCKGNGTVDISDLLIGVNIALGSQPLTACPAFDCGNDQMVTVSCLVQGVNNALDGCGAVPTPTPMAGCHSNADCTDPIYPNCGPDGNCWTQPCSTVCSGGESCCGPDFPYCASDGSCWDAPCVTLCGDTCCGPSQQCQNNTTCADISGCQSNADCTNSTFPYCGPDGNCWTQPCTAVCRGGESCCGGADFPFCGPDGNCWSAPCSTLCGDSCCGPALTCEPDMSCSP